MIRVLVVEDENVIRDGLMKHVPWQELGIGEVRAAANGEEALSICKEYVPDIISSDIRMPGMTGVELCEKIRELFPDITILFVTGYSDKEYLKAAINLHAVRYVEKPIQIAEYSHALLEAVRQVRQIRERKASQIRTLTFGAEGPMHLSARYNRVALLHLEDSEALTVVRDALIEQLLPLQREYEMNFLTELRDSDNLMLLVGRKRLSSSSEKEQILRKINQCIHNCTKGRSRWFLSYGSEANDAEQIRQSWDQASRGLQALSYLGWDHSVRLAEWESENHDAAVPSVLMETFTEKIVTEDLDGQKKCLDQLYQLLIQKKVFMRSDIRFLYLSWYRLLLRARKQRYLTNAETGDFTDDHELFERAQTFSEMHECLLALLEKSAGARNEEGNTTSYVVQKVTDYIADHCADQDLSIRVLADHVGLTPAYLSNLFKKETGITVGQYLLDMRIGRAKYLMKDPQKKIYEIADQVGYEDVDYFARVFKRATGMTPSEYRRKQL